MVERLHSFELFRYLSSISGNLKFEDLYGVMGLPFKINTTVNFPSQNYSYYVTP